MRKPNQLPLTPLAILRQTHGQVVSVELDNGETVNGSVIRADRVMNLVLKSVIRTSADGKHFWQSREAFIRGASIRCLRLEERALSKPSARSLKKKRTTQALAKKGKASNR